MHEYKIKMEIHPYFTIVTKNYAKHPRKAAMHKQLKCYAFAFQNEDIWSPFYSAMKSSLLYSDQAIRYTANIDIAPPQLPLPFGGW